MAKHTCTKHGRKIIAIIFSQGIVYHLNEKFRDLTLGEIPNAFEVERFNPSHAHIFAIQWSDYRNELGIAFTHPEFQFVPENQMVPEYRIDEARRRFPFLFELKEETNPVLWRDFGNNGRNRI